MVFKYVATSIINTNNQEFLGSISTAQCATPSFHGCEYFPHITMATSIFANVYLAILPMAKGPIYF